MKRCPAAVLLVLLCGAASAQSQSWTSTTKLALTYFFYWYNEQTGAGITSPSGGDGLTLHPPPSYLSNFAWTDTAFYQTEFSDMVAAGIDVALPVYWGNADPVAPWSGTGLQVMVQALQSMAQGGQAAPRIGLFMGLQDLTDANGGVMPDLTTASGKSLFYRDIHQFFAAVPAQFWATIDGRPIVVLYTANLVGAFNQSTFDYVAQQFQQDFGTTPYIIRQNDWYGIDSDAVYIGWTTGYGPTLLGDVASITPGFDNEGVTYLQGEQGLHIADRNCGDLYRQGWNQILSHGARLVLVETWNELYEGSGISATEEYGRQYINLTAQNVTQWKSSASPPAFSPTQVWMSAGPQRYHSGLDVALNFPDGEWLTTRIAGHDAMYVHSPPANSTPSYFIYLAVDDRFPTTAPTGVWVTVEYLDIGNTPWTMEYDGAANAYTPTAQVVPQNTGQWKTHTFYLPDAIFQKREATGASDLRIDDYNTQGVAHYFGRIWITKTAPTGQPPQMPILPDIAVAPGTTANVALTALDSSGNSLPLTLAVNPGFASLQGKTGAQSLQFAPSSSDVRSCAQVVTPGVASSPYYVVTATANDPNSGLPSGAVSFTASVTSSPTLTLSTPALSFTATAGVTTPVTETLSIYNSAGSSFQASITTTIQSGGNWLQGAVGAATAPGTENLQFTASPAGLAAGTYLGTITVNAPALGNPTQTVPVTLTVTAPASLAVSSRTLTFNTVTGQNPPVQSLAISNTGPTGSVLAWTASVSTASGGNWLSVTPTSGTNAATIQVAANTAALAPGSYIAAVTIGSSGATGSPATVAVTLTVSQPPTIQAIYDSWNYTSGVAPGAWLTIAGTALTTGAPQTWATTGSQLPTTLGGVTVSFNGLPAPVYYVSPTQINVLAPSGVTPGPVQVTVQSGTGASGPFAVAATATLPAVYAPASADGSAFYVTAPLEGTALLVGNSAVDPRVLRAAQPGDILDLYMIGLGATADPSDFITNQIFSGAYPVSAPVSVTVGGESATVLFAGLTSPGLYLVRIMAPSDLAAGQSAIQVSTGGAHTRSSLFLTLGAAPQGNLLQNGSFESPLSGNWQFSVDGTTGAVASIQLTASTAVDGSYSAEIGVPTAAATTTANSPCLYCAVQLWQGGVAFQQGHVYVLRFWAKADTARTMNFGVGENGGGFPSYGLSTAVALGADWQQYVFYFQATATDPAGRLNFYFGNQSGNTWLDAVVLQETN